MTKALADYHVRSGTSRAKAWRRDKGKASGMPWDKPQIRQAEAAGHPMRVTRSGNITIETRRQRDAQATPERRQRAGRNRKAGKKNLLDKDFVLSPIKSPGQTRAKQPLEQDTPFRVRRQAQSSVEYTTSVVAHMGEIPVGRARTLVNTVCNTGEELITPLVNLVTDDNEAGDWQLYGNNQEIQEIDPGQCQEYKLTLAPTSAGIKSSRLDIRVGDSEKQFSVFGKAVEEDSLPPPLQHIAMMEQEAYNLMTFNGENNMLLTDPSGSEGRYYLSEGSSFTGRQQVIKFKPLLAPDSMLCPGPGEAVIESGYAPALNQRLQGQIVRQVIAEAIKVAEGVGTDADNVLLRKLASVRLHDASCPGIKGKVAGRLEVVCRSTQREFKG